MAATGLSAVEETTEGVLTDSRTATTRRPSSTMPPSDKELGSSPSQDRKNFNVAKVGKNILDRLQSVSKRRTRTSPVPIFVSDVYQSEGLFKI